MGGGHHIPPWSVGDGRDRPSLKGLPTLVHSRQQGFDGVKLEEFCHLQHEPNTEGEGVTLPTQHLTQIARPDTQPLRGLSEPDFSPREDDSAIHSPQCSVQGGEWQQ